MLAILDLQEFSLSKGHSCLCLSSVLNVVIDLEHLIHCTEVSKGDTGCLAVKSSLLMLNDCFSVPKLLLKKWKTKLGLKLWVMLEDFSNEGLEE